MKFVHMSFHFEYEQPMEELLDKCEVEDYVRYPMIDSKDCDGKHYGDQVHPGNASVIQAQVAEEKIDELFKKLEEFKNKKKSHHHLKAVVLPTDRVL